jgi:hypothetical protein
MAKKRHEAKWKKDTTESKVNVTEATNTDTGDERLRSFIEAFSALESAIHRDATARCAELIPLAGIAATANLGPRFPAYPFSYNDQLNETLDFPVSTQEA